MFPDAGSSILKLTLSLYINVGIQTTISHLSPGVRKLLAITKGRVHDSINVRHVGSIR